ncbi:DUF6477 family protein [Gemmobacter nectariphilus]|uniref:DUF6477 family protein n=1 Tax=Gemmobacter nectariphilus TaxID=220343 RepID=UPI00041B075C|nr:DUF6477 family protein [Gemmobacter nectariphilus]
MTDTLSLFAALRRPRLMIRAARLGMQDYRRDRDLRRLLGNGPWSAPERALDALLDAEARAEATRKAGDAAYSIARHVELLIAMMAEARLVARRPA